MAALSTVRRPAKWPGKGRQTGEKGEDTAVGTDEDDKAEGMLQRTDRLRPLEATLTASVPHTTHFRTEYAYTSVTAVCLKGTSFIFICFHLNLTGH